MPVHVVQPLASSYSEALTQQIASQEVLIFRYVKGVRVWESGGKEIGHLTAT